MGKGRPRHEAADTNTEREDLVRVFGGRRGIVGRPRPPTDDVAPTTLGRTGGREPFLDLERRLEQDAPGVTCLGGQRDRFGRCTSTDLCALGRIRGLEHEGPRHRGQREIERDIDEDCEEHSAATLRGHGPDSSTAQVPGPSPDQGWVDGGSPGDLACAQGPTPTVSTDGKRLVSVVDDDESLRRSLRNLLSSVGFRVETFAAAEDFLQSTHRVNTGCLVLDLRLSGMSGLELLKHLDAIGAPIPTVILTAHDDAEARRQASRAGAVAFFGKPFHSEVLLDAVRQALAQSGHA
jgi:CheY-like chemotaxis protein